MGDDKVAAMIAVEIGEHTFTDRLYRSARTKPV